MRIFLIISVLINLIMGYLLSQVSGNSVRTARSGLYLGYIKGCSEFIMTDGDNKGQICSASADKFLSKIKFKGE